MGSFPETYIDPNILWLCIEESFLLPFSTYNIGIKFASRGQIVEE